MCRCSRAPGQVHSRREFSLQVLNQEPISRSISPAEPQLLPPASRSLAGCRCRLTEAPGSMSPPLRTRAALWDLHCSVGLTDWDMDKELKLATTTDQFLHGEASSFHSHSERTISIKGACGCLCENRGQTE